MKASRRTAFLTLMAICFIFGFGLGCGGGTSGTGVTDGAFDASRVGFTELRGVVVGPDGAPIERIGVQQVGNDFIVLTDEDGRFFVGLDGQPDMVTLRLVAAAFETTIDLALGMPGAYELTIIIDPLTGEVLDTRLTLREPDTAGAGNVLGAVGVDD